MILYETHPRRWMDGWIRRFLLKTWGRKTRKSTFHWDWEKFAGIMFEPVIIEGDETVTDRLTTVRNFKNSELGGWKDIVILEAINEDGTPYTFPVRIGFSSKEWTKLCRVTTNRPTAFLIGKYETSFYAVDLTGKPVRLREVRRTTRKELGEEYPLF